MMMHRAIRSPVKQEPNKDIQQQGMISKGICQRKPGRETKGLCRRWRELRAYFRRSRLYRIFVLRPFRDDPTETRNRYQRSGFLLFLAIVFGADFFNPIVPLEELSKQHGILEDIQYSDNPRGWDQYLWFKNTEGEVSRYALPNADEEIIQSWRQYRGQPVTIWTDSEISVFGPWRWVRQLHVGEEELVGYYSGDSPKRRFMQKVLLAIVSTCLFFALLPLLRIAWKYRAKSF
jgi:hypothetical protein